MRHANSRLTLDEFAQALTTAKRAAHLKVVEMIGPPGNRQLYLQLFPRVPILQGQLR